MQRFIHIFLSIAILYLTGCQKDKDNHLEKEICEITLMMDPNGLGDLGHNDMIYQGVADFCFSEKSVDQILVVPSNWDDALTKIKQWQIDTTNRFSRRLLILANENYGKIIDSLHLKNTSNSQILLVGGLDTCYDVYTRSISMYGLSCWAGYVTAKLFINFKDEPHPTLYILAANNKDKNILSGVDGFVAGLQAMWGYADGAYVIDYVSQEANGGYSDFEEMYKLLKNRPKDLNFIYPLFNGNNMPLLYYFLHNETDMIHTTDDQLFYMSGTDVHNEISKVTPFVLYSVYANFTSLVSNFLYVWYDRNELPLHKIECFDGNYVRYSYTEYLQDIFMLEEDVYTDIIEKERQYLYGKN